MAFAMPAAVHDAGREDERKKTAPHNNPTTGIGDRINQTMLHEKTKNDSQKKKRAKGYVHNNRNNMC